MHATEYMPHAVFICSGACCSHTSCAIMDPGPGSRARKHESLWYQSHKTSMWTYQGCVMFITSWIQLRLIKRNRNSSTFYNILNLLKFYVISISLKLLKYWIRIQYITIYWIMSESPNSIYRNIIQYLRLKLYFWNRTI